MVPVGLVFSVYTCPMPLYEYRCEEDGELITLLRPMAEADDPVADPEGRGRTYSRVHSVFQVDMPKQTASMPHGCGGSCSCHGG